jgi:hypothetical protein
MNRLLTVCSKIRNKEQHLSFRIRLFGASHLLFFYETAEFCSTISKLCTASIISLSDRIFSRSAGFIF